MRQLEEHLLMRIFIGEGDRFKHTPLYEALLDMLRKEGIAGATVLRGVCSFGTNRLYHTQKLLDLSADLPLIVEVVDSEEKISLIMPRIEEMVGDAMITLEKVTVVRRSQEHKAQ
ncbi:MAG: DUF190 domain-containing protein [Geobacter sp.]|nr:DUF190 domain-containing protein [Geobacter sp.]